MTYDTLLQFAVTLGRLLPPLVTFETRPHFPTVRYATSNDCLAGTSTPSRSTAAHSLSIVPRPLFFVLDFCVPLDRGRNHASFYFAIYHPLKRGSWTNNDVQSYAFPHGHPTFSINTAWRVSSLLNHPLTSTRALNHKFIFSSHPLRQQS